MLRKLLKHEINATSRLFLPVYGATLVVAIFARIMMFFQSSAPNTSAISLILSLSILLFTLLVGASAVLTLVIMISRFHKNLLGEQGYLMLTLPAKPWQHIVSKLLTSTLWMFASGIVSIVSFMILMSYQGMLGMLIRGLQHAWQFIMANMDLNLAVLIIEIIILVIASIAISSLMIYFAIALGHRSSKNRVAAGFGWYIAIWFILQILCTTFMQMFPFEAIFPSLAYASITHVLLWTAIILMAIPSAFFFWGTNKILTTKLNLE